MNVYAEFGANRDFALEQVVLCYRAGHDAFATVHRPAASPDGGPPYLDEGHPITLEFLRELGRQLGSSVPKEILPGNVLVRTADMLVWWIAAQRKILFHAPSSDGRTLNGRCFPIPPLLFQVQGRELRVRALASGVRPTAGTRLMTAPFWNTDRRGLVCQGSMCAPGTSSPDSIPQWERAFFESEFTHAALGVKPTAHPEGYLGLWRDLAGKRSFPVEFLLESGETLQTFAIGGDD